MEYVVDEVTRTAQALKRNETGVAMAWDPLAAWVGLVRQEISSDGRQGNVIAR